MKKKDLGNKYACFQCGCKFYDLNKPRAICPKCGVDQAEAPKKGTPQAVGQSLPGSAKAPPRTRGRRKSANDDSLDADMGLSDETEDSGTNEMENGLSLIEGEDLDEGDEDDVSSL